MRVLENATRQDLAAVKSRWPDLLESLNSRKMVQLAALLHDAEPSAASADAFVLKFKHDIHCRMAMENETYFQTLSQTLEELTGTAFQIVAVPEKQWTEIRQEFIQTKKADSSEQKTAEEDPLVKEAIKLVGPDLLEIKN
jgi:DNA polymerase-3 subunit gamma/tau